MRTATKLTAYGAALVLVTAGAWATGTAVGPLGSAVADPGTAAHGDAHSGTVAEATGLPPGLSTTEQGLTLRLAATTHTGGPFAFTITGPDGAPVTAFDVEHEKRMHLVVVRRDGSAFRHVHPEMAPDGTWTVPLERPAGGSYRAFADFVPTGGEPVTLGVDVSVPGEFVPVEHAPSRTAQVGGYTVTLDGDLVAGQASPVTLTVARDGVPVTDLEPYLGAYGHLVALRGGDLAYLHVHPEDGPAGPGIGFVAEVPSAGTYRLFLDFSHGGVVRTAEFTVPTGPSTGAGAESEPHSHEEGPR